MTLTTEEMAAKVEAAVMKAYALGFNEARVLAMNHCLRTEQQEAYAADDGYNQGWVGAAKRLKLSISQMLPGEKL